MSRTPSSLILSTPRLTLRPFADEDAEDLFALNADPDVVRHTGDSAYPSIGAVRTFIRAYDQYEKYRMGRLAVVSRSGGAFLGWCGLKFHPDDGLVDLGFRFHRRHWGFGYATEAARACLHYGFTVLKVDRITGRALAANTASIRVLEKIGMEHAGDAVFHGEAGVVYILDRDKYVPATTPTGGSQPAS